MENPWGQCDLLVFQPYIIWWFVDLRHKINKLNIVQKYLDLMQLNWALVSGKQMEHDGTMETNIPHINPMSPRHTSLENLFSGSRIYQRKMEMDGRTFVVFFVHCFFFRWIWGMPQMSGYFPVGTQFLFLGAGDAMQKKESGQVESLGCLKFPCMST